MVDKLDVIHSWSLLEKVDEHKIPNTTRLVSSRVKKIHTTEQNLNKENIFHEEFTKYIDQLKSQQGKWLRAFRGLLSKYAPDSTSEILFEKIHSLLKKSWLSQEKCIYIRDELIYFCNKYKLRSDGGIFLLEIDDTKYFDVYFEDTARSMREFVDTMNNCLHNLAKIQADQVNLDEIIRHMYNSYALLRQDQKINNMILEKLVTLIFKQEEKNISYSTRRYFMDTKKIFFTKNWDDSILDKYPFMRRWEKIPLIIPDKQEAIKWMRKLDNLNQTCYCQRIRDIPECLVIEFIFHRKKYFILMNQYTNDPIYNINIFTEEPSDLIVQKVIQPDINMGNLISMNHVAQMCMPMEPSVDFHNLKNENGPPGRGDIYMKVQGILNPGAWQNFHILTYLIFISLTQPEHIIREAYELCGLDCQDYQYRREDGNKNSDDTSGRSKNKKVVRYYPYQDRSKRNQEARQWVQHLAEGERKSEASGKSPVAHKVLLPAKKKPDGAIQSYRPSPKYQEIAKELGFELGKWIQLFDTNEVIYPENIAEMLQILEKKTIEDAVDFLNEWVPKDQIIAAIRYETVAVPQQKSPETQEVIDIVYARVRHITDRNRFSETKWGSSR